MSPRGRPRVPEREVTITDVTQHSTEILTDQDFLITTPSDGDFFRHDGTDWVNHAGVDAEDINAGVFGVGDMTVQGALRVQTNATVFQRFTRTDLTDESWDFRITNGGVFELWAVSDAGATVGRVFNIAHATQRVTFSNLLTVEDELIVAPTSATSNPIVRWNQGGTARARIQFVDSDDGWYFTNQVGAMIFRPGLTAVMTLDNAEPAVHIANISGELLRLDDSSATGNPYLAFYQDGSRAGYLQYLNSRDGFIMSIDGGGDNILTLRHNSATGSPYLAFYQAGTRRAYIQFNDSLPGLRLRAEQGHVEIRNPSNHTLRFDTSGDLTNFNGDVIATVP